MYKSLTKTKKYSELEAHEALKRVASANAIIRPDFFYQLINGIFFFRLRVGGRGAKKNKKALKMTS